MTGVGSNDQVAISSLVPVPSAFSTVPAATGSGAGWLLTTCQRAGAVTVNWNVALRSGCSKTGNMRRESGTSNWEYRYTSPSAGSTKRCRPSPVFV